MNPTSSFLWSAVAHFRWSCSHETWITVFPVWSFSVTALEHSLLQHHILLQLFAQLAHHLAMALTLPCSCLSFLQYQWVCQTQSEPPRQCLAFLCFPFIGKLATSCGAGSRHYPHSCMTGRRLERQRWRDGSKGKKNPPCLPRHPGPNKTGPHATQCDQAVPFKPPLGQTKTSFRPVPNVMVQSRSNLFLLAARSLLVLPAAQADSAVWVLGWAMSLIERSGRAYYRPRLVVGSL